MTFVWTPTRIADAHRLYITEGKSAAESARSIGDGCTRNAVIGKAHRMGWLKEARQPAAKPAPRALRSPRVPKSAFTPPRPGPQNKPGVIFGNVTVFGPVETEKRRQECAAEGEKVVATFNAPANDTAIPLITRGRFQCSWPVGEPDRSANQMCCGQPVPEDSPRATPTYCPEHALKALSSAPRTAAASREYVRKLARYA